MDSEPARDAGDPRFEYLNDRDDARKGYPKISSCISRFNSDSISICIMIRCLASLLFMAITIQPTDPYLVSR